MAVIRYCLVLVVGAFVTIEKATKFVCFVSANCNIHNMAGDTFTVL